MKLKITAVFRPADFIILILFVSLTIASFLFLKTSKKSESRLVITSGEKEYIYPLSKNRVVEVDGHIGKSVIVIEDGRAYFKSSPCNNKICVQMGAVTEENEWAACMPNDIFIKVN